MHFNCYGVMNVKYNIIIYKMTENMNKWKNNKSLTNKGLIAINNGFLFHYFIINF